VVHIEISGNTGSLKASVLTDIKALYDFETDKEEFLPEELILKLSELTGKINREIAIYIDRKGKISDVNVGDSSTVTLSEVEGRRGNTGLSGVRCIHTHPNGDGMLSSVDLNSLVTLRLDAMVSIGVRNGALTEIYAAIPTIPDNFKKSNTVDDMYGTEIYGPFDSSHMEMNFLFELIRERSGPLQGDGALSDEKFEKAVLVGLETEAGGAMISGRSAAERSLDELEELSRTAGLIVLEKVLQKRPSKDAAYYIGKGKLEQIGLMLQAKGANTLVFDDELSGAQIRNIEDMTGAKVIDRTTLILDIFAGRAHSSEGKLQVELAQLKYRLPRLTGLGGQLSRLGGGIGTRGPGEKKLETDRRHIRKRISQLEEQLKLVGKRRGIVREGRKQEMMPVIALVGYTNSGKSSILNRLCKSDVLAEDKLFATLDPTTRKLILPDGRQVLLVDTVGFIRKLPHDLVEAFKSTLEEMVSADMLLHIADASDEETEEHVAVADDILKSLGAADKPTLLVLNKIDLGKKYIRLPTGRRYDGIVEISAVTGQGTDVLLQSITDILPAGEVELEILAPYSQGWITPYIHRYGRALDEVYGEDGIKIHAKINRTRAEKLREYVV